MMCSVEQGVPPDTKSQRVFRVCYISVNFAYAKLLLAFGAGELYVGRGDQYEQH